jgi:hypothetical protein
MKKGMDRLRIALGMGLLSSAVLAATRSAQAAPAPVTGAVLAGGANWNYANNTDGSTNAVPVAPFGCAGGNRIESGKPGQAAGQIPAGNGGTGGPGCGFGVTEAEIAAESLNDAFDGALVLAVNGTVFKNPDATIDLTGTTVTSDSVNIGGLGTQVQFFFEPTQRAVRAVYSFTNTTAAAIVANVLISNNLGSDSNTRIEATADGDTTVEPGDSWVATNDNGVLTRVLGGGDPPLTWIRYQAGAPVITNAQPVIAGLDDFRESYTLNVPAGQTQRLMVIVKLNSTVAASTAAGPALDTLAELGAVGLLAGLDAQQQSQLVNWVAAAQGTPRSVPAISGLAQLGLMLTLAVGGLAAVRLGNRSAKRAV